MVENQHLKLGLFFIHSDMQNNNKFMFNCLKKNLVSPSPFTFAVFMLQTTKKDNSFRFSNLEKKGTSNKTGEPQSHHTDPLNNSLLNISAAMFLLYL